jgi:hypothetical protein
MDLDVTSYCLGEPFPDDRYITSNDSTVVRISPHSFDVVITLNGLTDSERRAIVCNKFNVSIFVHKQVPAIIFDFKEYTCECTINIQKIRSVSIDEWIADTEDTIVLYLLEAGTGNIINMRFVKFPLMKQLKYLLSLQFMLSRETIDSRYEEAEQLYSVPDMINYSIFYGEVPESGIKLIDSEDEYKF